MHKQKIKWNVWRKLLLSLCTCICAFSLSAQQNAVTGVVTDENNESLPGVTIQIKGKYIGVVTDANGKYSITVPDHNAVLVFSFVGYATQEVAVGDRTDISITLAENVQEMEEVVVVGYGVQKKVSLTGAVSTVNVEEMKVSSSASLANALAGRITGLTSYQSSGGQPGRDDATMYLRGAATLNGTSPLILIDGVPRDNIRTLDPNEVESISVLKDASATAVFGVRGANGVVMITTRRGKEEKPELNINVTRTYQALTREPSRLHSLDYLRLRNEALTNDNLTNALFPQTVIDKFADPLQGLDPSDPDYETKAAARRYMYPDNDWYRILIARWAPQTVVNANLTGGSEKISYFMNVGYMHQGGNLKTEPESVLGYDPSVKMDRYSFRSNVDYKITPSFTAFLNLGTYIEKVNMPLVGSLYNNNQGYLIRDIFNQAQILLPLSPGPTTIAGFGAPAGKALDPSYLNSGQYMDRSPYKLINNRGCTQETRANLNSSLGINWDMGFLTEGLSLKGMLSYDSNATSIMEKGASRDEWRAFISADTDELTFSNILVGTDALAWAKWSQSRYSINAQVSLAYNRKFGRHEAGGMIVAQRDYWESTDADIPYNVIGLAARLLYNYDERYFGEFNFGYNGSEQFAPDNRFGAFPAASVGWVVSNESFLKDHPILTFLKLRASAGKVGNDKLGGDRFLYIDNITMGGGAVPSLAAGAGINESLLGNYALQWEVAQKYNIGVDFRFLKAFTGSVEWFYEHRSQILMKRRSPPVFQGLPLDVIPRVNMGEVKNQGYEIELGYHQQLSNDLFLSVKGNYAFNRNKRMNVDEVLRDENYEYRSRETGFPIGQLFGYAINREQDGGYWTPETLADPDRIRYDFGEPRPGDFVYVDNHPDGMINDRDMVPIGYGTVPRINWGASLNIGYRGLDLYVFFQGLRKYNHVYSALGTYETTGRGTYFDYHRTAWTEERWRNGETITYPALSTRQNTNHVENSFFIQDRTFTRLKNVELGYTLPQKWLGAAGISRMRIFVNGQNIFTWARKFRSTHLDPEGDESLNYPITKMFSFGANVTF
ncbi:MAG: TonB-dependent receptor [Bacteroidales bacterium]|jgi:TonB-linked SusC/RagA family outer membrane protein|nr:TonB-dependent receptor [Bacteroidales bacterium]